GRSSQYPAALLYGVRAIPKAAGARQLSNLVKCRVQASLPGPKLEFAHTGRVDERTAARQRHQLTVRCRMATAAIGLAHLPNALAVLAKEPVDQRRFAHARRAQQSNRPSSDQIDDRIETGPVADTDRHDGRTACDAPGFGNSSVEIVA